MGAPKEAEFTLSFPLDLGVDNTAHETAVQPVGERAALVRSVNTRLSVVRGAPTKAPGTTLIEDMTTAPCGGIVPCGSMDSSIAFFHPEQGSRRIVGDDSAPIAGLVSANATGSYYPAQVSRAGSVVGGSMGRNPCVAYDYDTGGTWFLVGRSNGDGTATLMLHLMSSDGGIMCQPTIVDSTTTSGMSQASYGVTAHTGKSIVWYKFYGDQNIYYREVTRVGAELALGSETTLHTAHASGPQSMAVASDNQTYAYLVFGASGASTSVTVMRVTAATMATSAITYAVTALDSDVLQIAHYVDSSLNSYVGVIIGQDTTDAKMIGINGAAMSTTWGPTSIGGGFYRMPTVGFGENGNDGTYYCFTVSDTDTDTGDLGGSGIGGTYVEFRSTAGSKISDIGWTGWYRPTCNQLRVNVQSGVTYPLIVAQRFYDPTHSSEKDPGENGFLYDPSIEVFRVGSGVTGWTPLARVGVDTALRVPLSQVTFPSAGYMHPTESRVVFTYLEDIGDNYSVADGWPARYVELDFEPTQPRFTFARNGTALIAAAMPAQWDGVEVTEIAAMHQPVVSIETSGGSSPALSGSGPYYFAAINYWVDAQGGWHRSAPSLTVSISGASMQPIVRVTTPMSLRDGVRGERMRTIVYASLGGASETTLYAQNYAVDDYGEFTTRYEHVTQPTSNSLQIIYTDGAADQELPARCPPGFRDVEVVGLRAWGIEAERPNVAWPSKLADIVLAPTVAFEWNPDLRIEFPAHAGDGMAVRELGGMPVFFTTRGIYQVSGPGPNNLLEGEWNSPEQLSDTPCTSRFVLKTPVGVLFISNNRYALYAGQVRVFENMEPPADLACVATLLLRESSEAVFVFESFGSSHVRHVYNYALDRWTTWNEETLLEDTTCAVVVPTTGAVLAKCGNHLRYSDLTASTTAQMVFETGQIAMGGPQDDFVVNDVIIQGIRSGAHGMTVAMEADYGATTTTTTYGPLDIQNCTVDSLYTLSTAPKANSMRTLKLTLTETGATGEGMRPLSVTIVGHKNPTTKRDAVKRRGKTPEGT